jgi:hypothetical protein
MADNSDHPEQPRLEPEIIPPARARSKSDWSQRGWQPETSSMSGTHRIYVTRLGPFGMTLLMLIIGLLIAVVLLAVLGAVLVWIPILALLVAVGFIFRLLRR